MDTIARSPNIKRPPPPTEPRPRILYVEDDDLNWDIVKLLLRREYEFVRATTAAQAFALMREQTFSVVMLDVQLAGSDMNGIAIAQMFAGNYPGDLPAYAIPKLTSEPRIIFLTASDVTDPEAARLMGSNTVLRKPLELPRLQKALRDKLQDGDASLGT